jgi:type I restriction enzyme S subunit
MEVKPGYKQTDLGVIPENWDVKCLGELGSVVRGGSPRPAGDPRYFNGNFIPWLTVAALTNISENQLRVSNTVGFLTEEGAQHSRTLVSGTLIIANSGATLGVAKLLGVTCCANDGVAAIINQKAGDKEFVCHYINSQTKHLRDVVATGNGQPNLNTTLIRELPIPFPPTDAEQRAIARALSDVDALLGALDQLIAKKRDLKKAAMQQLLTGQKRLPGFHGEWEVKRLGDVAEITMGQSPSSSNYNAKGVGLPLIQGNADIAKRKTIRRIFTTEITKRGKCGDILMSVRAPVGEISRAVFDVCLGRGVCAIRYDNDFMYHYLISQEPSWVKLSKGSTFDSVNSPDVKALEIHLPIDTAEQTAIAEVLSDMDAEIAALEQRRDKTRALKQGMMHELLTGKTRLVDKRRGDE